MGERIGTQWFNIEKSVSSVPVHVTPFTNLPLKKIQMGVWTKVTLKNWKTIQTFFDPSKKISSLADIGFLEDFIPSNANTQFKKWSL